MKRQHIPKILGALGVVFLLTFPFYGSGQEYIMHLWITAFYYAILASSWSLLAGYAGQFSFGHMAFMAIGAYGAGLFTNYVRITTAATKLCTEFQFGSRWIVFLNAQGVTNNAATCLDIAKETMPAISRPATFSKSAIPSARTPENPPEPKTAHHLAK